MAEVRVRRPLLIAHRGASAYRPEHTLAAYRLAIAQGADFIEPDLVLTRDGVLVARHENEIGGTTDIADRPAFASRRRTQLVDGAAVTGWFTEDLTLAEIATLRARERLPALRPQSAAHDGTDGVPTFAAIMALVAGAERTTGRRIGVYPETKHPSHFASLGLDFTRPLLAALEAAGRAGPDGGVFVQSFEVGNLQALRAGSGVPIIQLIDAEGGPVDRPELDYAGMATTEGLRTIAGHADGVGVHKALVIGPDGGARTALVDDAHAVGLSVHAWTVRPESAFLAPRWRRGDDPAARGDMAGEVRALLAAGVDGLFTDDVPATRAALAV